MKGVRREMPQGGPPGRGGPEVGSRLVALLGRRDQPTDALEDYSNYLGEALARRGHRLEVVRVPFDELGNLASLPWLWRRCADWREAWVLVQYAPLQWSRRGFPFSLLLVLWLLRRRGIRTAVVLHDPQPRRLRRNVGIARTTLDRARRWSERFVLRTGYRLALLSLITIPLERVGWLSAGGRAVFLPVGPNFPVQEGAVAREEAGAPPRDEHRPFRVAVFGMSEGALLARDLDAITAAARAAVRPDVGLELVVFGRGTREAEAMLRERLAGTGIEVSALGLVPPERIGEALASADVQLFVRGGLSSRRGSAIAGIACGLAVVGYAGPETGFPITEAGVVLVPENDHVALGDSLVAVLAQDALREELACKSRNAYQKWFSWDQIALGLITALTSAQEGQEG